MPNQDRPKHPRPPVLAVGQLRVFPDEKNLLPTVVRSPCNKVSAEDGVHSVYVLLPIPAVLIKLDERREPLVTVVSTR